MVAAAVAVCGYFMDEGEWNYVSTMGWFWCENCVAAIVSYCDRNAILLQAFLVIWIHSAIVAGCGSGPQHNRNIPAALVDVVRNLNHWNCSHSWLSYSPTLATASAALRSPVLPVRFSP